MTGTTRNGVRTFTVARVLDAPRELVFQAWIDPAHFTHWWGPRGFTTPLSTISLDVRPGGIWRATMINGEDGTEYPFHGIYREVVPPEKLSFSLIDPDDPDLEGREAGGTEAELAVVTLHDRDGRTELVYEQESALPDDTLERAKQGMAAFFESLADYLTQATSKA